MTAQPTATLASLTSGHRPMCSHGTFFRWLQAMPTTKPWAPNTGPPELPLQLGDPQPRGCSLRTNHCTKQRSLTTITGTMVNSCWWLVMTNSSCLVQWLKWYYSGLLSTTINHYWPSTIINLALRCFIQRQAFLPTSEVEVHDVLCQRSSRWRNDEQINIKRWSNGRSILTNHR